MLLLGLSRDHCVSNYAFNHWATLYESQNLCNVFLKMFGKFVYLSVFGNVSGSLYTIFNTDTIYTMSLELYRSCIKVCP